MYLKTKKAVILLTLSILGVLSQLNTVYSNSLNLLTFIENIKLSKDETKNLLTINKKTEDVCFRFFPSYVSMLDEIELAGSHKNYTFHFVKLNFISWINYSNHIQIVDSEDHILTSLEKQILIEKLKESVYQSLFITDNFVMYNILFNDSNYNGTLKVLNICDDYNFNKLEYDQLKEFELLLANETINHESLAWNKEEPISYENYPIDQALSEYSKSTKFLETENYYNLNTQYFHGLLNFKDNKVLNLDTLIKFKDKVKKESQEEINNKEIKENSPRGYFEENIQYEKNQDEQVMNARVLEDTEKELSEFSKVEQENCSSLKSTNLRKAKKGGKPYKNIKNCNFYMDKHPIISNQVYIVGK